jgi:hypothetical protein
MQDFPVAQLLALLLLIVLPLANWLLERLRRRFEPPAERRQPPPQPAPRTFASPAPSPIPNARIKASPAPAQILLRRPAHTRARALFASRSDLRRAIILMTVLGPCRGAEPADLDGRHGSI